MKHCKPQQMKKHANFQGEAELSSGSFSFNLPIDGGSKWGLSRTPWVGVRMGGLSLGDVQSEALISAGLPTSCCVRLGVPLRRPTPSRPGAGISKFVIQIRMIRITESPCPQPRINLIYPGISKLCWIGSE